MRIFLFLALSLTLNAFAQEDSRGYIVSVGEDMPEFDLTGLDGTRYTNATLAGKTVVLQFTASWCSVCRQEMPELEAQVHQAFKDREFVLIGVDYDEPAEKVAAFADQMRITYPIAPDPEGRTFHLIAAPKSGVTRNVVIDPQGTIQYLTRLYDPEEFSQMIAVIDSLTSVD